MSELGDEDDDVLIREEGYRVWSRHWDGVGAGVESIYEFKNEYWYDGEGTGELSGPFESFAEAMEASGGFWITDATQIIYCSELTADELATRADLSDASPGHRVEINDEEWEVSPDGKLERARDRKSG